jgi:hypothetical protein
MRKRFPLFLLTLFLMTPRALAAEAEAPRIVVQQNGQALVTETRALTLGAGPCDIVLDNLAETVDPQSIQARTAAGALRVQRLVAAGQSLSPSQMLRRHVGKQVRIVIPDGKSRDGRMEKLALLLSIEESPLFLVDGQVYAGPVDAILYPAVPLDMTAAPRFTLHAVNSGAAKQNLELTYVAREFSWRMDYLLTLNSTGDTAAFRLGQHNQPQRQGLSARPGGASRRGTAHAAPRDGA